MAGRAASAQLAPFPASSKMSSGLVNDTLTTAASMSFADKLLITLAAPDGKLAHWVHVPLGAATTDPMNPSFSSASVDPENALLPRSDLTATTVLGGTKREDEAIGQMLATMIASAILTKRPNEERMLVLGLGAVLPSGNDIGSGDSVSQGIEVQRAAFDETVRLVLGVL